MNHDDQNDDIDNLLRPSHPFSNDLQTQKWQSAVRNEVLSQSELITTSKGRWWLQLTAAMIAGMVVGALLMKSLCRRSRRRPRFWHEIRSITQPMSTLTPIWIRNSV